MFSMAFGECAATICIARENGSLMLQTGQRVESDTECGSFILRKSINPTARPSNAIWPLLKCALRVQAAEFSSEFGKTDVHNSLKRYEVGRSD